MQQEDLQHCSNHRLFLLQEARLFPESRMRLPWRVGEYGIHFTNSSFASIIYYHEAAKTFILKLKSFNLVF